MSKKKLKEKVEIELTFLEKFQSCFKANKIPDDAEIEESEELEDEDLEDLKTVRDAVDYVHEHAND